MKIYLTIFGLYFRVLSLLSNKIAGQKAFQFLQKPRKLKFRQRENQFYQNTKTYLLHTEYGEIPCYETGNSNGKLVILVHGWESNAGSLSGIGHLLAEQGFRVISFDLPAHGNQNATHTNLFECKEVLKSLVSYLNPAHDFSIVSHSFGSAVATYAMSEVNYSLDQFICLSSPNKLAFLFETFKEMFQLPAKPYKIMLEKIETLFGKPLEKISVEKMMPSVNYKNLTIIHDINDKVLPFAFSKQIAASSSSSELITIKNVGHYRMVWDRDVFTFVLNRLSTSARIEPKLTAPLDPSILHPQY